MPGPAWRATAARALDRDGCRITGPRGAVLDWIARAEAPFTAETLARALTERGAMGSRATAYRLVARLLAGGWIGRVRGGGHQQAYARSLPEHHSVVCLGCGVTLAVGGCDLSALLAPSLAGTGFAIEGHALALYGRCRECRAPVEA